jgi:hypothetical protein
MKMGEANPIMYLLLAYSCVVSSGCPWLRGKLKASVLHFKTNVKNNLENVLVKH